MGGSGRRTVAADIAEHGLGAQAAGLVAGAPEPAVPDLAAGVGTVDGGERLTGWREVALPIGCQFAAGAVQVYGLFHEIPHSERIITLAILGLVVVQLWVTRPRS